MPSIARAEVLIIADTDQFERELEGSLRKAGADAGKDFGNAFKRTLRGTGAQAGRQLRRELDAALKGIRASVRVTPDTVGFRAALQAEARSMAPVRVTVTPNTTGFRTTLQAELKGMAPVKVLVEPNAAGFRSRLQALLRGIPPVRVRVEPDTSGFRTRLQALLKAMPPVKVRVEPDTRGFAGKASAAGRGGRTKVPVDFDTSAGEASIGRDLARIGSRLPALQPRVEPDVRELRNLRLLSRDLEIRPRIVPDFSQFEADWRRALPTINRALPAISARVEPDWRDLRNVRVMSRDLDIRPDITPDYARFRAEWEARSRALPPLRPTIDARPADPRGLGQQIDDEADIRRIRVVRVRCVRIGSDALCGEQGTVTVRVRCVQVGRKVDCGGGSAGGRGGRDTDVPDISGRADRNTRSTGLLARALKGLGSVFLSVGKSAVGFMGAMAKWTSILGLIAPFALQAASSLIAFGTAASQAVKGVAVLPALVGVAAASLLGLGFALKGTGKAFGAALGEDAKKFEESLKGLPPAAQDAAREFRTLRPAIEEVRKAAAGAFFGQLTGAFKQLGSSTLPQLKSGIADTAGGFGKLARATLDWVGSASGVQFFNDSFRFTAGILDGASKNLGTFLTGFQKVASAGFEALTGSGSFLAKMGESMARFAESGGVADWIQQAREGFAALWNLLKGFSSIFSAIGQASRAAGTGVSALGDTMQRIGDLLKTPAAQSALIQGFQALQQVSAAMAPALVPIGQLLASIAGVMAQLAVAAAPAIAALAQGLTGALKAAGPGLQVFFDGLSQGIQALSAAGPAIGAFIGSGLASLGPMFTTIGQALAQALPLLGPGLTAAFQGLAEGIAAVAPALPAVAKALSDVFVAVAPLLPVLGQLAAVLLTGLAQAVSALAVALQPVITALADSLSQLMPVIAELVTALVQSLAPAALILGKAFADLIVGLTPFMQVMGESLTRILVALEPIFTALAQAIADCVPALIDLQNASMPVWVALAELAEALSPLIVGFVKIVAPILRFIVALEALKMSLVGAIVTKLLEFLAWLVRGLTDAAKDTGLVTLLKETTKWLDRISDGFKTAGDKIRDFFNIKKKEEKSADKPIDIKVETKKLEDAGYKLDGIGSTFGTSFGNNLTNGINSGMGQGAAAMGNGATQLGDAFTSNMTGISDDIRSNLSRELSNSLGKSIEDATKGIDKDLADHLDEIALKNKDKELDLSGIKINFGNLQVGGGESGSLSKVLEKEMDTAYTDAKNAAAEGNTGLLAQIQAQFSNSSPAVKEAINRGIGDGIKIGTQDALKLLKEGGKNLTEGQRNLIRRFASAEGMTASFGTEGTTLIPNSVIQGMALGTGKQIDLSVLGLKGEMATKFQEMLTFGFTPTTSVGLEAANATAQWVTNTLTLAAQNGTSGPALASLGATLQAWRTSFVTSVEEAAKNGPSPKIGAIFTKTFDTLPSDLQPKGAQVTQALHNVVQQGISGAVAMGIPKAEVTALGTKFDGWLQEAANSVKTKDLTFAQAMGGLTDKMNEELARIAKENNIEPVQLTADELIAAIQPGNLDPKLAPLKTSLDAAASNVVGPEFSTNLQNSINTGVTTAVNGAATNVPNLAPQFQASFNGLATGIGAGSQFETSLKTNVTTAVNGALTGATTSITTAAPTFTAGFNTLATGLGAESVFATTLKTNITAAVTAALTGASLAITTATPTFTAGFDTLATGLGAESVFATTLKTNITAAVTAAVTGAALAITTNAPTFTNGFNALATGLGVGSVFQTTLQTNISTAVTGAITGAATAITTNSAAFTNGFNALASGLGTGSVFQTTLQSNLTSGVNAAMTAATTAINNGATNIQTAMTNLANGPTTWLAPFQANLTTPITNSFTQALTNTKTGITNIATEIGTLGSKATAALSGFSSSVSGAVGSGMDSAVSAARSRASTIAGILSGIRSDVASTAAAIRAMPSPPSATPNAMGGIYHKRTFAEIAEAGSEVVIPLTKPGRARQLVQASGLLRIIGAQAGSPVRASSRAASSRNANTTQATRTTVSADTTTPGREVQVVNLVTPATNPEILARRLERELLRGLNTTSFTNSL